MPCVWYNYRRSNSVNWAKNIIRRCREVLMAKYAKLKQFLALPFSAKLLVLRRKLGLADRLPLLVRLPDIGWWIARPGTQTLNNWIWHYEAGERRLLSQLIQSGWIALDIGAHYGLYTLLIARKVSPDGLVIAFEPSPRELKQLLMHLWINRCHNVQVEAFALGDTEGEAEFFLYDITSRNSLRPQPWTLSQRIKVPVITLDTFLELQGIKRVDFIKMDTEGAELSILQGMQRLLERRPRPIIVSELSDSVTEAWGYPAKAIYEFLAERGFHWFSINLQGTLFPCPVKSEFKENLVAVPKERLPEIQAFIEDSRTFAEP